MKGKNKNFLDGIMLKLCEKLREAMFQNENPQKPSIEEDVKESLETDFEKTVISQVEVKNIFIQSQMLPDNPDINTDEIGEALDSISELSNKLNTSDTITI